MKACYDSQDTDLIVRGVIVDKIDGFSGRRHWDDDSGELVDFLRSESHRNPYGADADYEKAIWRTLVGDRNYEGDRAPGKYACVLDTAILDKSCLSSDPTGNGNIDDVQYNLHLWWVRNAKIRIKGKPLASYLKSLGILRKDPKTYNEAAGRVDRFLWNRRLVSTALGYIGITPHFIQKGDTTAVIGGCAVPLVLRPRWQQKPKHLKYEILGLAVISVAFQLTEACIKLYTFWEAVEDAPQEIIAIKEDLRYLISVFKGVESYGDPLGGCLGEGVQHCRAKVADLISIVEKLDGGFQSLSRRKRFAAAAGHVELCALLIKGGADKSALAYEGPSDAILSPISLFVASCTDEHADTKIAMLRLFCECIDIADADSDGWSVHDWLKRAYAKERVPISQNSITWLLHFTMHEEYVGFSARNIWSALQHAMRSILNHARHSNYLQQILCLSKDEHSKVSRRHLDAVGSWLALRMKGFDWMEDNLTHKQFLQALPSIYSAWCNAVLDCVEQEEAYMREELHGYLCQLGMTRGEFVDTLIQTKSILHSANVGNLPRTACTSCKDDYGLLTCGLVEPARIAITECVRSGHNSNCVCGKIPKSSTVSEDIPEYTGTFRTDDKDDATHADDEFFDAQPYVFSDAGSRTNSTSSMFTDIATLLYSAQGRIWLGEHSFGERLCSTCFLLKEKYIGEDGLSADFPPIPRSFGGLRVK
ncbi:hypothetical protein GT037_004162 [Alternaria burnsii]|uniref:Uncharacterized protein n=1 Tax=Alternaria burnsii TaxID=1187904 RepID=A0A8H7EG73_9PLEO|nr:uncharacterized protein GT037_004162 [Alternaria burnsii]KAF7677303.1 hypothetical protein GT037_004162 [Alternaria burnsii]